MRVSSFILCCAGVVFFSQARAACEVTDDAGNQLNLLHPAKRIIVLSPDLTESIFAIGAGDAVVGVIKGSDYPSAVQKIAVVGAYSGIDLERIVTLKPDLIVTWKYAFPRQLAALKQLGIPVYVSAPHKLEDVPRQMRQLGCLTGKNIQAEAAAKQFEDEMAALAKVKRAPLSVFFQIGDQALMTINRDSWINQVLSLCGGKNVFADARAIAPEVSREAVLAANPKVILINSDSQSALKSWQAWSHMQAVMSHHLYVVNPDWISRAGPRLVLGAKQICAYFDTAREG